MREFVLFFLYSSSSHFFYLVVRVRDDPSVRSQVNLDERTRFLGRELYIGIVCG